MGAKFAQAVSRILKNVFLTKSLRTSAICRECAEATGRLCGQGAEHGPSATVMEVLPRQFLKIELLLLT